MSNENCDFMEKIDNQTQLMLTWSLKAIRSRSRINHFIVLFTVITRSH